MRRSRLSLRRITSWYLWIAASVIFGTNDRITAQEETPEAVARWIAELQSDSFEARESASRALVDVGPPAVAPLRHVTEGANLEVALRSIQVLHAMCLSNSDATWTAAEEALRGVADGKSEVAASCARDVLRSMPDSAVSRLVALGGRVFDGPTVKIGKDWRGRDDGLVTLRWVPRLRELWLEGSPLSDVALQHLEFVPVLRVLAIRDIAFSDAALTHLRYVPKLETLHLNKTLVTDQGISHLAPLTELRFLEIESEKITDAAVEGLSKLKNLETLSVRGTSLTPQGIAALRTNLENTDVQSDQESE